MVILERIGMIVFVIDSPLKSVQLRSSLSYIAKVEEQVKFLLEEGESISPMHHEENIEEEDYFVVHKSLITYDMVLNERGGVF
jgi:hypothetical protein